VEREEGRIKDGREGTRMKRMVGREKGGGEGKGGMDISPLQKFPRAPMYR